MEQKVLKASCVHCGKEVFSIYRRQLEYNINAHELSCIQKQIDSKTKREPSPVKDQGEVSNDILKFQMEDLE